MPRKVETEIFTFRELPKKGQEKAIQDWREAGHSLDFIGDDLSEVFKAELNALGLPDDNVQWSLGYSQGDGVAFYGTIDVEEYLRKNKLLKKYKSIAADTSAQLQGENSRYHHWNSMQVLVYYEGDEIRDLPEVGSGPKEWRPVTDKEKLLAEFEEHLKEHIEEVSRTLEKMGYDEIEYLQSDEQIADTLEANEYEYTADGKRW